MKMQISRCEGVKMQISRCEGVCEDADVRV